MSSLKLSGQSPRREGHSFQVDGDSRRWRLVRYVWPLFSLIWLTPVIVAIVKPGKPTGIVLLNLAGVGLFVALWVWVVIRGPIWDRPRLRWALIGFMTTLAIALNVSTGGEGIGLFIYVSVLIGFASPVRAAVGAIAGVVLVQTLTGWVVTAPPGTLATMGLLTLTLGLSMIFTGRLIEANAKLRAAQEEIARLAVDEERLRFARDLHDLLGHNLSAIALKLELARRVATVAPERAQVEIGDAETMVRDALRQVREAVSGYRQPHLTSEMYGAREILSAAGIDLTIEGDAGSLPPTVEAVLGWTVREGVTNVVRHSRARHCTIRIARRDDVVALEMLDDGRGVESAETGPAGQTTGNGLRGVAERVVGRGGSFEAGPLPGKGFYLRIRVPLDEVGESNPSSGDEVCAK